MAAATRNGWYGCDLDGTLAEHEEGQGVETIGAPVPKMVARVQAKIAEGFEVRVFTARVGPCPPWFAGDYVDEPVRQARMIWLWTQEHVGTPLVATATKDYACLEIWDDRARQVIRNVGVFPEEINVAAQVCRSIRQQLEQVLSRGQRVGPTRIDIHGQIGDIEKQLVIEHFDRSGVNVNITDRDGGHVAICTARVQVAGAVPMSAVDALKIKGGQG